MRSLRVLFLATRDWYHPATTGGDMTMWEEARYLASAGHSVTFVSAGYNDAAREETLDGMRVVRLGGIHSLWFRTFLYYVTRCHGLYDVVVTEGFGGSRIPRLAPLYVHEPIITEWHQVHRDLFAAQYPRWMRGPLNLLEHVTAFIHRNTLVRAGTDEWGAAFASIGFKPTNIFVLPVSIRDDWFAAVEGTSETAGPNVLWLGKFRRYKCPDHVVLAMSELVKKVPGARLTLAGRHDDVAYERQLKVLVRDLGLNDHIDFQFNISEPEKRQLLRDSRVLALPSAVEGFGIVVLEANAYGLPVVASSRVPEGAVRHERNGLRYEFGDIPALAAALARIIDSDALYSELSSTGRGFARGFAWSSVGAEFERVVIAAATKGFTVPTPALHPERED